MSYSPSGENAAAHFIQIDSGTRRFVKTISNILAPLGVMDVNCVQTGRFVGSCR